MLSITRDQVPSYLVGGTLYKTLCLDDSKTIHVPIASFKDVPYVCGSEDVVHLLHTLKYWRVSDVPDELCTFLAREKPHSDFDELCVLLEEFLPQTKLVDWFRALWTLRKPYFQSEEEVKEAVQALVPHLLSPSGVVSDHSRIELIGIVHTIRYGKSLVSKYLPSINGEINSSSCVANVRNVARLYACLCDELFSCCLGREVLLFKYQLLGWPDEEVVEYACRALKNMFKFAGRKSVDSFSLSVVERYVELLRSDNPYIQGAAMSAVRYFTFASQEWAGIVVERGALTNMRNMLFVPEQTTRVLKDTIQAIANCCTDSATNVQIVINLRILQKVIELHKAGVLQKCVLEEEACLWCAVLSGVGECAQIQLLLQIGAVPVLCELLPTSADSKKDYFLQPLSGVSQNDILLQNLGTFLQKCRQVELELWHSVVAQMKECGGVHALHSIAGDSDHPSSRAAEDVLRNCD